MPFNEEKGSYKTPGTKRGGGATGRGTLLAAPAGILIAPSRRPLSRLVSGVRTKVPDHCPPLTVSGKLISWRPYAQVTGIKEAN